MSSGDPVIDLENALALVFDAEALTLKGLRANPSKEEQRKLNKRLASLVVEEADLIAMIDALENRIEPGIKPPTDAQVTEIAKLSEKVEQDTQDNITASDALATSGKVLELAMKVSGG